MKLSSSISDVKILKIFEKYIQWLRFITIIITYFILNLSTDVLQLAALQMSLGYLGKVLNHWPVQTHFLELCFLRDILRAQNTI